MCYSNCPFEKQTGPDPCDQSCTFDPRVDYEQDMHCYTDDAPEDTGHSKRLKHLKAEDLDCISGA